MNQPVKILTLVALLTLAWGTGRAEEGGGGHYAPGVAATFIDLLPTEPGFILQPIYLYYKGDTGAGRSFPLPEK